MKWFGADWGAMVCNTTEQVPTPVGQFCCVCDEPIRQEDRGLIIPYLGQPDDPPELPYHFDCFVDAIGVLRAQGMPS